MKENTTRISFGNAGLYFIGLVALVILGFWRSYFSLFFGNDYAFYFHFHATMVSLWIVMLIVQPMLIRKKRLHAHRLLGKIAYVLMPLLLLSVLLMHNYIGKFFPGHADFMFVFGQGVIILAVLFIIGVRHRHNAAIHARAMLATGIIFIEPALIRLLLWMQIPNPKAFYITITIVSLLLITLIILERRAAGGRWVFPLVLVMYLVAGNVKIAALNPIAEWFVQLPLTPRPVIRDLPVPANELDGFTGTWKDPHDMVTFKKGDQLWMYSTDRHRTDTSRLLYQGKNTFVCDHLRPLSLHFRVNHGKAETIDSYFAYIYRGTAMRKPYLAKQPLF